MTSKAQQIKLDNALVALENHRVIGIRFITAEVLVIFMHQFWAIVDKHKASYRFKIDNKKFSMNIKVFRGILNICLRIPGQEFDEPPSEEEALSFIRAEPLKSKKPKTKSYLAISSEEIPSKKKPTKAKKDVPSKKKSASKPKPTKKKALVEADKDENLNLNPNDDKEEEKEEDDVRTPDSFEFNDDDEEYDELYKDVNVRSKFTEPKEVGKEDAKMD
ncbi:hypothetical protein Tco_1026705 [Tanacetum coccineum]